MSLSRKAIKLWIFTNKMKKKKEHNAVRKAENKKMEAENKEVKAK